MADVPPLISMSDLKPKGTTIKLGDEEYGLRFTLNAIDDIQDHFDIPIEKLGELFNESKRKIQALRYLLTLLINEDIDCVNDEMGSPEKTRRLHLDERYVGRHIDAKNMKSMMSSVLMAFVDAVPKTDEDDDPNA